jgi:integrase
MASQRPRAALTKLSCDAAKVPEGKSELMLPDGGCKNLYLRVRKTSKTWVFLKGAGKTRAKAHGKAYELMTVAEARVWANDQRKLVLTGTGNPQHIASAARQAIVDNREKTLGALLEARVDDLRERGKPSWPNAESCYRVHVPAWIKAIQASHVQREDVLKVVRQVQLDNPEAVTTAKAVVTHLSAAFSIARKAQEGTNKKLSPTLAGYGITTNPAADIDVGYAYPVRERALNTIEANLYLQALLDEPAGLHRDVLLLSLLLGGQRVTQMATATFDVDTDGNPLILILDWKNNKNGAGPRPHVLPLHGLALKILGERGDMVQGAPVFGITREGTGRAPYNVGKLCGKLCQRVVARLQADHPDLAYFSPGNIRSTCTTLMRALKIAQELRNQVQSHNLKTVDVVHYDKFEGLEDKRAALEQVQQALMKPPAPALARARNGHGQVIRLASAA